MAKHPSNLKIEVGSRDVEEVLREFRRKSTPVMSALKKKRYFQSRSELRRNRKIKMAARLKRQRSDNDYDFKPWPIRLERLLKKGISHGVMMLVIVPFDTGAKLVVIKDRNRSRPSFPYGGVDKTDKDILHTAKREVVEELFSTNSRHIPRQLFQPKKWFELGLIRQFNHIIHIFYTIIDPALARYLRGGLEQEWVSMESPEQIRLRIERGRFSPNHAIGFQLLEIKHPDLIG